MRRAGPRPRWRRSPPHPRAASWPRPASPSRAGSCPARVGVARRGREDVLDLGRAARELHARRAGAGRTGRSCRPAAVCVLVRGAGVDRALDRAGPVKKKCRRLLPPIRFSIDVNVVVVPGCPPASTITEPAFAAVTSHWLGVSAATIASEPTPPSIQPMIRAPWSIETASTALPPTRCSMPVKCTVSVAPSSMPVISQAVSTSGPVSVSLVSKPPSRMPSSLAGSTIVKESSARVAPVRFSMLKKVARSRVPAVRSAQRPRRAGRLADERVVVVTAVEDELSDELASMPSR